MTNKGIFVDWRNLVGRIAAILLGLVFSLAAFSKLGNLGGFQTALASYDYIPDWLKGVAVLLIPGLELVTGLCLLSGRNQPEGGIIAAIMLWVFIGLGFYSEIVGSPKNCGCFDAHSLAWLEWDRGGTVGRNLILEGFAILCILWDCNPKSGNTRAQ